MTPWRPWVARWGVWTGMGLFLGGILAAVVVPVGVIIAGLGALVGLASAAIGSEQRIFVRRTVCLRCGRRMLMLGINLRHCSRCGSPFPPQDDQPANE